MKARVTGFFEQTIILYPILITLCLLASCKKKEKSEIIHSNSNRASINVNSESISWIISPEINPDIFSVVLENGNFSNVTFKTDLDSLTFKLGAGDRKDFIVLLNNKDSAHTSFQAIPPPAIFTDKYVKENRGKWVVEVVDAQELLQVIFAITPTGIEDTRSFIINHDSTSYYLNVLKEFLPFKKEPIVKIMDSLLKKGRYIQLKANACAYKLNEIGEMEKSPTYDRMTGTYNPLDEYLPLLNDFALKSNFQAFYKKNEAFYDSLIVWHEKILPTKTQWNWLERQFPDHSYDHYRITFSPLVKGNHSTVRFRNNNFKQAIMFIRPPYKINNVGEKVSEGLLTRFVFTEIDHNYVNPETDKHTKDVNESFKDRDKWTSGKESKGYNSPYAVFNEYMTWSVYLLYCYDQYNKEDLEVINDRIVNYMINRRGFTHFDDFHSILLKLYMERSPNTTVSDLYIPLLEWATTYNPK